MKRSDLWVPILETLLDTLGPLDEPALREVLAHKLAIQDWNAFECSSGSGEQAFTKLVDAALLDLAHVKAIGLAAPPSEGIQLQEYGHALTKHDAVEMLFQLKQARVEALRDQTARRFGEGGWKRACQL